MLMSLGFQYTDFNAKDSITTIDSIDIEATGIKMRQYDATIDMNFLIFDITQSFVSPYVGVGIATGLTSTSSPGRGTTTKWRTAGRINAGFEIAFASSQQSKTTIASINSWDFAASNGRPREYYIGFGLRFWFRP